MFRQVLIPAYCTGIYEYRFGIYQVLHCTKIHPAGVKSFHVGVQADRQTDREKAFHKQAYKRPLHNQHH